MRGLRQALRRLVHEPGFAAVAILTLAVGIGANTAIFSLVDNVLLKPLTFAHPEQLVVLHQSIPQFAQKYPFFPVNGRSFDVWRRDSKLLDGIALLQPNDWVLTGEGEPRRVSGAVVTSGMFSTLGVRPRLGRDFTAADDQPGHNHVILLTDTFWRSAFHSDPTVVGRTIDLDGAPNQIIGVLPASLHFPHGPELGSFFGGAGGDKPMQLFRPVGQDLSQAPNVGNFNYLAFARMKPGVTPERLKAELDVLEAGMLASSHAPADIHVHTVVTSLRDQIVGDHALGLWLLLAAVGAILLIVCLNLANLMLVRVHGRGHEIAIRVALGASRARLLRETVGEAVILAVVGGAMGVLAAEAALRWLVHAAPAGIPRLDEVGLNPAVLGFTIVLAAVCGVLFSLWPAWRAARTDPQRALRAGGRNASDTGARLRARSLLVGAQAALATLLLAVAGLLSASYLRLLDVHPGFQADHVVKADLDWTGNHDQRAAFYRAVLAKVQALPGVQEAGLIDTLPTQGTNDTDLLSYVNDTRPLVDRPLATFDSISPDYFAAMGIPVVRGRALSAQDEADALVHVQKNATHTPVAAVISAYTAAKIWPGKDAVGQQFRKSDPDDPPYVVVGIAADVRAGGLDQPPGLAVYQPYTWQTPDGAELVVRTQTPAAALAPALRAAVWSVQPAAAVPNVESLAAAVASSIAPRRFQLTLVGLFALCALLLAALGIYGVVAYSVERRAGELSLRMTLGASGGNLAALVLRQGMAPVVLGLVAGIAGALAAGRVLAGLLFDVHATDPAVLAGVSAMLLAVAALACALPARRATRISPMETLRS